MPSEVLPQRLNRFNTLKPALNVHLLTPSRSAAPKLTLKRLNRLNV